MKVNLKVLTDENGLPVSVEVPYDEWRRIADRLEVEEVKPPVDLNEFAGTIKLTEDPMEYQRRSRDERS